MIRRVVDGIPSRSQLAIVTTGHEATQQISRALEGHSHRVTMVELSSTTRGQADTIARGLQLVGWTEGQVAVVNCDVCVDRRDWASMLDLGCPESGKVLIHHDNRPLSAPPIFSYIDSPYRPHHYAEKIRISSYAQSGAWNFRDVAQLLHHTQEELEVTAASESYLSHVLHRMARAGIIMETVQSSLTIDLGTPELVRAAHLEIFHLDNPPQDDE